MHVKFNVVQLAAYTFDLTDIDVLHDVAGLRVNQHGATWALENLALHGGQQCVTACAFGGLKCFVNHAHAVVTPHGHEVGAKFVGGGEIGDKFLVHGAGVRGRVVVRCDHTQGHIAHVVQLVVIGHVTRADQADTGFVQAPFSKLFHELRALA